MKRNKVIVALVLAYALAAAVWAGIKPSLNATVQEVESGTTLSILSGATLAVASGATFTISGSSFAPSAYALLAGADFTGRVTAPNADIGNAGAGANLHSSSVYVYDASEVESGFYATAGTDGSGGDVGISVDDGAVFMQLTAAAGVEITGGLRAVGSATPPVACAAGSAGTIYYDSDVNELCVCNASSYVQIDDMTTGCS